MGTKGIINETEINLARRCIDIALAEGADSVRASLSKTISNGINVLDGETDKVTYSEERSILLHVFASGRYGVYSTNRLEYNDLKKFIKDAVGMTELLGEDPCRSLPAKDMKAGGCTEGDELGLEDEEYPEIDSKRKNDIALSVCNSKGKSEGEWTLESSEEEYSDSYDDNYIVDSDGFEGRHIETSYAYCTEATIKDRNGNRFSGYWWDASPFFRNADFSAVGAMAISRAAMHINPRSITSGLYGIVVDRSCASRLVSPLLQALDAQNIQQGNSFLAGKDGKKLFSDNLTLYDRPLEYGCPGSRLFDFEGVATKNMDLISDGAVANFLVNTYMAHKTGMAQTVEDVSRPCIRAHICNCSKKEINLEDICRSVGKGLYITDFNGGNCNPATGNFSFGVEGLLIDNGEFVHPVKEMLMTGNMIQLWSRLLGAGSDPRKCARWQIPTLAFEDVMINN